MTKSAFILALTAGTTLAAGACSAPAPPVERPASSTSADSVDDALYVGICGFSLAGYDPGLVLRFYARVSHGHGARAEVSGVSFVMTALRGWDDATQSAQPPASVSSSETVGDTITATSPLSGGRYTAAFGALDVTPLANTINGEASHVEGLTLDGPAPTLGQPFCGGLAGELTQPGDYTFKRDENTCLFFPVAEGDPLPTVQATDFHCE
jgi:hypothetical protein